MVYPARRVDLAEPSANADRQRHRLPGQGRESAICWRAAKRSASFWRSQPPRCSTCRIRAPFGRRRWSPTRPRLERLDPPRRVTATNAETQTYFRASRSVYRARPAEAEPVVANREARAAATSTLARRSAIRIRWGLPETRRLVSVVVAIVAVVRVGDPSHLRA